MPLLELSFASGESSLSVRRFSVHESISGLFTVSVWARSEAPDLDLGALVGKPASLRVQSGVVHVRGGGARLWTGICCLAEQLHAVSPVFAERAESTYAVRIVPTLWLLGQRRNLRIFQHLSIPDITDRLLAEWSIEPVWKIDRDRYPKLEFKTQYDETDYDFLARLWEEAGIAFTFPDDDEAGSRLVLGDKLHAAEARPGGAIHYVDNPSESAEREFISHVGLSHQVRPGAYTIRDYDFRNPAYSLLGKAPPASGAEAAYEQYEYRPGGFLVERGRGGDTPVADDRGVARYDQPFGHEQAERALLGARMGRRGVEFRTNTIDLWPGVVFSIARHPHPELDEEKTLLVTDFVVEGTPEGAWSMAGQAVFTDVPYRPPFQTTKPEIHGVQSALVVGPAGEEIHTDEFGRVRVQFPWDREGKQDEQSSCWMRVSQGWAGTGFGMIVLPRIGQEVLVSFLEGDPDQPIVVGRVYNAKNPVPYKLPDQKTQSAVRSETPRGDGFNELRFEDKKESELYFFHAEKNLRQLVKNDETITVGHDRFKAVNQNETDTTILNRVEVTGMNRSELTSRDRRTVIGGNRRIFVVGDEDVRTEDNRLLFVDEDADRLVKKRRREAVIEDDHLHVKGDRVETIDGKQSVTVVEDRHEKVEGRYALSAARQVHMAVGNVMAGEGGQDVTVRGPGGFLRIDASGVTISGRLVKINIDGSPGQGRGSTPELPEEAEVADIAMVENALAGGGELENAHAARRTLFEGTGKRIDLYKLAKGSPERAAVAILRAQGRKPLGIRQILESATDFRPQALAVGDKLYGFVSAADPRKSGWSPYWVDKDELDRLRSKFFSDGRWDSAALKDVLALPCVNAADAMVVTEVIEAHTALAATILPAKDKVYQRVAGVVERRVQSMIGGGTQVTPSPGALGQILRGGV